MNSDVMNILNDLPDRFPDAISFASGRPATPHVAEAMCTTALQRFVAGAAERSRTSPVQTFAKLMQYGPTAGFIGDSLCRWLEHDLGLRVDPDSVIATIGCQEALFLILAAVRRLCANRPRRVLTCDPGYIGFTGAARLLDFEVCHVPMDGAGLDLDALAKILSRDRGATLLYDIPSFHYATGVRTSLERRRRLLELAEQYDFYVIEDDTYSLLAYDDDVVPSLRELDGGRRVFYVNTFSKTLLPGLRLGLVVLPDSSAPMDWKNMMTEAKSVISLNTSSLTQVIVAGILDAHGHSLKELIRPTIEGYRRRRDCLLNHLEACFSGMQTDQRISWNCPRGGLFLDLEVPRRLTIDDVMHSGERGVIWIPLSLFTDQPRFQNHIRLAIGTVAEQDIGVGVTRLAEFLFGRLHERTVA